MILTLIKMKSFTFHCLPFTIRYPFTINRAAAAIHGKRFMVNVWKTVNGERLMTEMLRGAL